MKTRHVPLLSILALGIALAYPAAAQVTPATDVPAASVETVKQPSAAENLRQVKTLLSAMQAHVTSTMAGLNAVKNAAKEGAALDRPHGDFVAQYQALEAHLYSVRQQSAAAKANSEAYFKNWQQSVAGIQNKDIKETATDRFNRAKAGFNKVLATAEEARQKIQPFLADLKDIHTFLKVDLTADSVKSLSDTTWRLGRNSETLVDAIADVNREIDIALGYLPKN